MSDKKLPTTLTADIQHPFHCRCAKIDSAYHDKELDIAAADLGNSLLSFLANKGLCTKAQTMVVIKILAMTQQASQQGRYPVKEEDLIQVLEVELAKPYPRTI